MAGIYIPGMEMPQNCMACQWSMTDIANTDWCVLTKKDLPCDCQLVAVPDHGDLIDRDALLRSCSTNLGAPIYAINEAPTIIPADREVK